MINKITAVALATLTATSLVSTSAFASSFNNNNHNGCGLEEVNSGKQFAYFVINSKVIGNADPVIRGGVTFVSAPDILDELGIEYTVSSNKIILTANVDGHEYVFNLRTGMNTYYTKDGEKIYNKVVEQNGVKVPENTATLPTRGGKIYVPLSFFTKELGYSDAFSVDDSYCLNMGTGMNYTGGASSRRDDFITGEKKNCNKTIAEGWVCPQVKSVSKDNIVDDAKTLINELEFEPNGPTSAVYNPQGTKGISVGPYATGSDATHFTNITIVNYGGDWNDAKQKINKVVPQVLKFYFPNSWQKVDEILKKKEGSVRYTIDGRDTVIEGKSGNISMSRVNGSLQGFLADIPNEGTIGTAYDVQRSYTGYWTQYGTQYWHYFDSNNKMLTGWQKIEDKWYYFDENGRMLTNTVVNGYKIGSDGVWIQ